MNLLEIDGKSIENDVQPGRPVELGHGMFSGVYRVRAIQSNGFQNQTAVSSTATSRHHIAE